MNWRWRQWPGLKFGMIGFAAFVIALMWVAVIVYFQYAIQRQIEYTYRTSDNLSAAFAAHTARALREIEVLMRVIAMEHRRHGRRFDLPRFAQEARLNSDLIIALIILDREGKVVQASAPDYSVPSHADREHFRVHVDSSSAQLYSARPVFGRHAKSDVIPFSLRVSGPDGKLRGVVVAGVDPRHFIDLYRKADLGDKGAVSFFGLDGFIRARITAGEVGVGQDVRKAAMIQAAQRNESGRLRFTAVTDNVSRYYSYQRVPGHPLSVAVGHSDEEALAEVNRIAHGALAGMAIITLLMIAVTMVLVRGVAREQGVLASLQARTSELHSTNKELETFSYSVAHDLRAPLRAIDGYSRLLQADYPDKLGDEGRGFLQNIVRAAKQMSQLIDDLLAYSRLERRDMQIARVDARALVESLLADCADEIRTRGVAVSVALPFASVSADREGLAMALRNLLQNALKFTRDVAHPAIEVGGRDEDGARLLWVRDNGPGFDMKFHDRIFAIFQRLHRMEDYPGTGVGLAIVKKAMERMGGRAWAESVPGKGATFFLEVPE